MRHLTTVSICSASALCLFACGTSSVDINTELGIQPAVWVSEGYGYVIDLREGPPEAYHIAGASCVLDTAASGNLEASLAPDMVEVADGRQSFTQGVKYEPHRIAFHSQTELPSACMSPLQDTVEGNFQAFADIFAADYAFFDLYGVDWTQTVEEARKELRDDMSDEALFRLFANMIAPLQDGHLALEAEIDGQSFKAAPKVTPLGRGVQSRAETLGRDRRDIFIEQLTQYWDDGIAQQILGGQGQTAAGGKVQYGVIDKDIGYIAVLMLAGLTETDLLSLPDEFDLDGEYNTINAIMDDAMTQFAQAGVKAVIVDASVNFGGHDFVGREIAARFADRDHLVLTKRAIGETGDATPVYVHPSDRPSFTGPVYVMTTQSTVSAGEIMTLSMRALPNVTHVGQPTQGALSDILDKTLPNGWELQISNEIYRDPDGALWEGRGIPPAVTMEIVSETDLVSPHPNAVRHLVERIHQDIIAGTTQSN